MSPPTFLPFYCKKIPDKDEADDDNKKPAGDVCLSSEGTTLESYGRPCNTEEECCKGLKCQDVKNKCEGSYDNFPNLCLGTYQHS